LPCRHTNTNSAQDGMAATTTTTTTTIIIIIIIKVK
jgi:hypothetical protein